MSWIFILFMYIHQVNINNFKQKEIHEHQTNKSKKKIKKYAFYNEKSCVISNHLNILSFGFSFEQITSQSRFVVVQRNTNNVSVDNIKGISILSYLSLRFDEMGCIKIYRKVQKSSPNHRKVRLWLGCFFFILLSFRRVSFSLKGIKLIQ